MPNLIGTGNNQVPTNGMLGGLAYQSPDNAVIKNLELTNLSGHNSLIPSTAVDVFVYDTRKDSDGGAWRKRTQHTSWYNETLNTATRGSRRDFPAVAVIVATTTSITIYDGDDPDMSMWMVFNRGVDANPTWLWDGNNTNTCTSVFALNGIMMFSTNNAGSYGADFIGERWIYFYNNATNSGFRYNGGGIVNRNSAVSSRTVVQQFSAAALGPIHNDLSMTVLPNAPIDSVTGIPFPTIAVATNNGINIIRDDAYTVVSSSSNGSYPAKKIKILPNEELYHAQGTSPASNEGLCFNTPFSRISGVDLGTYANSTTFWYGAAGIGNASNTLGSSTLPLTDIVNSNDTLSAYTATSSGLTQISINKTNLTQGMVAYATTSYNTGWMHGDVKGAFLSDTSTTSVTGTELVTNGTFATNTTGWTAANSASVTLSSNRIRVTAGALTNGLAYQQITTVVGQWYTISYDGFPQTANTAFGQLYIRDGSIIETVIIASNNATQTTYSHTFQALSTTTFIVLYGSSTNTNGNYAEWDNISVRLAERDRSVNNKGLQLFGTITKSVVETGSNLVAYSGFSTSNYLHQPYNSALDFGNGNFYVIGWVKSSGGSLGYIWEKAQSLVASQYTEMYWHPTNFLYFHVNGGVPATQNVMTNVWNHFVCVRNNSTLSLYVNGIKGTDSTNQTGNVSNSNSQFRVGVRAYDIAQPFNGSIALIRIGSGAPSPEQILKIYNDEKALFQPNSQCTLFGSSDAVTALAYDDTTKLLHVGTSSGRSDFQGLERINNTTTAVTTAISASNGLIAEQ